MIDSVNSFIIPKVHGTACIRSIGKRIIERDGLSCFGSSCSSLAEVQTSYSPTDENDYKTGWEHVLSGFR